MSMPLSPHRRRCLSLALMSVPLVLAACAGVPRAVPYTAALDAQLGPDYSGVVLLREDRNARPLVKALGQAQFETGAPMTADTRFMVGSVSKWITAVAVLLLVEQGKLALDKPVTTWLPELPAGSRAVTLRHLLSNTSGIERGLSEALKRDPKVGELGIAPAEAAQRFGAGPLMFAPGTRFDYSSTNWVLVAGIVERATGEPFVRTVTRLVFEPAGVRDTGFADAATPTLPRMAIGYNGDRKARKMVPSPPLAAAAGTVYSTAADLLKIADLVYGDRLLSAASRRELMTVQHAPEEYALGGRVKQRKDGGMLAWESGVSGGYKTLLAYAPADGRAVVLLNNTDMAQSEQARIGLLLLDAMQN
jgi:D-alanyl-D-alanine carboxypeptidase